MATDDEPHDHHASWSREANADGDAAVEELRAERDEARRLARWLYDRSPALRRHLGDVSEWPWLLDPVEEPATDPDADLDRAVLRAFAAVQDRGDDPHDATDIADTLGLNADQFDGSVSRLIHAGLLTGGRTFSRTYIDRVTDAGIAAAGALDEVPGTREELRRQLERAGMSPNQTRVWLDHPAALLSGLVPALAITDPATAARTRRAAGRLAARIHGGSVPINVRVTDVRILEPGTHLVELHFTSSDGTDVRILDLEPYLTGPAFETVRTSYATFAQLYVDLGTVCWPGGLDLAPELLFRESWPARTADRKTGEDR